MRFAPKAYDVCDWCGQRREAESCSEADDHERYNAGWRRTPEGWDLCRACALALDQAIADVQKSRRALKETDAKGPAK